MNLLFYEIINNSSSVCFFKIFLLKAEKYTNERLHPHTFFFFKGVQHFFRQKRLNKCHKMTLLINNADDRDGF